jgi:hypothetical protein
MAGLFIRVNRNLRLERLAHEYSTAAELDPAWAARPLALTVHEERTIVFAKEADSLSCRHHRRRHQANQRFRGITDASDPKVKKASGGVFSSWALARECGLSDLDGTRPHGVTMFGPRPSSSIRLCGGNLEVFSCL